MDKNVVPYIVYEGAQAKSERIIKRLVIALVVAVVIIFANNAIWLYAWCQYDYTSEETVYTQDGEGVNIIGGGNNVTNQNGTQKDTN